MKQFQRLLFSLTAAFTVSVPTALCAEIEVSVHSIRSDKGKIMVALHGGENTKQFPNEEGAIAMQWAKASQGARNFVFRDLPQGEFAIALYHDENDNGRLDKGLMGIPKEGFGFSRNAKATFGPPNFTKTAVELTSEDETLAIDVKMRYRKSLL